MKRLIIVAIAIVTLSGCYRRIGDLNMVSNRNIDSNTEYVLIERGVESKSKTKKQDALEQAIDKAVNKYEGEYLMNCRIYVKKNGRKIKVVGDVWGVKPDTVSN